MYITIHVQHMGMAWKIGSDDRRGGGQCSLGRRQAAGQSQAYLKARSAMRTLCNAANLMQENLERTKLGDFCCATPSVGDSA